MSGSRVARTTERETVAVDRDDEPYRWRCPNGHTGASVILDPDPSTPGIDDLSHESHCPQRFARSKWFRSQL